MTPIEYIDRALALVVDRLARYPGYEVLLSRKSNCSTSGPSCSTAAWIVPHCTG